SIGGIRINTFDEGEIKNNPLFMPDKETALKCEAFLQECMKNHDSAGGTIDCVIKGLPCGIGETVFDKLDANLAKAMFSIGAVKGFEIGNGFNASNSVGSQNNDPFTNEDGKIIKVTNNSGGILGGMSDGSPVTMRLAFKPTPSIFQTQQTVDTDGNPTQIEIKGRHDPIIVPRAVIVVEAMAAITVLDLMLQNTYSKIENIKAVYDLLEKN
ncbi:MAG: chorismate synthase, partial [Anaerotignaceae bacterium]